MNYKKESPFQPAEVLVVEASAGAGKTYELAKRYLNLLINPGLKADEIPLKSILAITFTNKATVEMKERILDDLKRLAFDEFGNDVKKRDDLYQSLGTDVKAIQQKASQIMDFIIRDYDLFQVQTIDSFINALLTGCALHINRTAGFSIKDTPDKHMTYSLDFLIEESARNKDTRETLEKFVKQYLSASKNAGWFPKKEIFDQMLELYRLSNIYGLPFNQAKDDYSAVIKLKKEILKRFEELAKARPEGQNKTTTNKISKLLEKSEYFHLADLPFFNKYPGPPMNKGHEAPEEYIKQWRGIIPLTQRLAETEANAKYPVYTSLFNLILEPFARIAGKEDVLFLSELNSKAAGIIGNEQVGIAELYYRLATRFRHYLLDEFQDTSELQWRNLKMMIDDALGSGGSLFYVGDRKQAIFRFRGGEPQLFTQVADEFKHYNVRHKILNINRRSQKAIVEFNNWVFNEENIRNLVNRVCAKKEIADTGLFETRVLDIYRTAKQEYLEKKNQGYVRVDFLMKDEEESSEEKIQKQLMTTVKQLAKRFEYRDIAILTRDNKTVELITGWLMDEKLPVESERTLNVLKNRLITEIISLLKFLQSPIDELNFGGFILGEIFSQAAGLKQQAIRDYLFELKASKSSGKGSLYARFKDKYPDIWSEYMERLFKSAGLISPYELIITIYQQFRVMANFPGNQAFFLKFLDLIKSADDEYIDMDGLLAYISEQGEKRESHLYVSAPQSNSVKVQTIHKSKGLEFPVVIIPFLEPDISRDNPFIIRSENGLDLLHITREHTLFSENISRIYNNDCLDNLVDELNSVYVALTRAKSELYVFIPYSQLKNGEYSNYAIYLIPKDENESFIERGKQVTYKPSDKPEHSEIRQMALSEYQDWLKSLKEETNNAGLFRNRTKIIEGSVMHFLLAHIPDCTDKNIPALVKEAIKDAKIKWPFIKDFSAYQGKLDQILKHPDLKPLFYITEGAVYCEKEFVNSYGDSRRIDRLIITGQETVIVDYKSTGESPAEGQRAAYQKQVKEYAEITSAVYPGRNIKAYIVFLDSLKAEEIKIN